MHKKKHEFCLDSVSTAPRPPPPVALRPTRLVARVKPSDSPSPRRNSLHARAASSARRTS